MSRRRLIFYAVVLIASMCFFGWLDSNTLEKGDRVRVTENTFGTRNYTTHQKLEKAAYHEDQLAILQYIYDGEARFVKPGTQGRVIMDGVAWIEIRFDDDALRNWWVKQEFVEKIK